MEIGTLILLAPVSIAFSGYIVSLIICNITESYRKFKDVYLINRELDKANFKIIDLEHKISMLKLDIKRKDEFIQHLFTLFTGGTINDSGTKTGDSRSRH